MEKGMALILDIETTGLPPRIGKKEAHWEVDYDMFPYVLEIAWKHNGKTKRYLIYQEGRKVPASATLVNGITTKMANDKKITTPADEVYEELLKDALEAGTIVGHNIYFDTSIIKADFLRRYSPNSKKAKLIIEAFHKDKRIDTMRCSKKLFNNKWPKLGDLYKLLFGKMFKGAHGAYSDMLATDECYLELCKRKII